MTIRRCQMALLMLTVIVSCSADWLCAEDVDRDPPATASTEKRVFVFNDANGIEFHCLAMGRGFTDDDMKSLSKYKRLRSLHFFDTSTTGAGLKDLSSLKELDSIHFVGTTVNDDCALHVAGMKSLKDFVVIGIRDLGEATYDVDEIVLKRMMDSGISDEGAAKLAGNTGLERLWLNGRNLTDKGILKLLELKKLEDLRTSHSKLNGEVASAITKRGLFSFDAPYSEISSDFVRRLEGNTTLIELNLNETDLSDEMAKDLSRIRTLRTIRMHRTKVTDEGFQSLSDAMPFTQIQFEEPPFPLVEVDGSPVPWQMKAALLEVLLTGQQEFKLVDIRNGKVRGVGTETTRPRLVPVYESMLPYLKYFEGLEAVIIDGPPLDESYLDPLLELKSLTKLNLAGTRCSDDFIIKLCRTSKSRNTIYHLNARIPRMGDRAVVEISKLPKLKQLGIDSSSVTDFGIEELSKSDTLESLGIESCNNLTDKSLESLSRMPSLRELHLDAAAFSIKGLESFHEKSPNVKVFSALK